MNELLRETTLAILAGGEGSRMGRPKGELSIHGQLLLAYLFRRLEWAGPTLLITAPGREHPPGHELFDAEAIDPVAGQGPLRGVLTALEQARTELVAVLTVDMPVVRSEHVRDLVSELARQPGKQAVMCRRMRDGQDLIEPFPSVYRRGIATLIAKHIKENRRSVHGLAHESTTLVVPVPDGWTTDIWTNLNDPSDLDAFLKSI